MTAGQATSLLGTDALGRGLAAVLSSPEPLAVLERAPNSYGSTFPSEIVTCVLGSHVVRVLCKYELDWAEDVYGYPAGVVYEADVYRSAVEPSGLTAPRCYGIAVDGDTGVTWLVVEHLPGSLRVANAPDSRALTRAARWIGSFHRFHESSPSPATGHVGRHDRHYFLGCVERALSHSRPLRAEHPWLPALADLFVAEHVDVLLARPTVVHGDFYPENVLTRRDGIYPVDWASAAWSAGEIDLAALTEGDWDEETVEAATAAYARARWESDPPGDLAAHLEAARMFLHFRVLGDEPENPFEPWAASRFEQLRLDARRLEVAP
jgi:hypothetical protein